MNKFFLCKILFGASFFMTVWLFSMPESAEMPSETPAQSTEMPTEVPAQPTAEMPDQASAQPVAVPQQEAVASTAQPATAATTEEVKSEQLGEFQIDENQPEVMKGKDSNIRNLINKSNELSKKINDVAKQINEIRDKAFNKFSDINNSLDAFYQKVGFESGRAKELLKEQK
ncbi:MAG: hypothetical protein WCS92_04740 [Candidatus Babeliales bacterium]|jgi:hypothetical protein|nr:MAG: hypothetical protein US22_C0016G0003 [candidate division TM6 bacterium GW2011_GWF2_36_6]